MNALDFRKRAIMSVINNVKGFERSASGTSVTLEGCVDDDSIIDYKIYGNCYQDGEPSIENPIEVQCVGDRTKNLFDISDYIVDKYNKSLGFSTKDLEIGKTYILSSKKPLSWFKISTNSNGYNSITYQNVDGFYTYAFKMQRNANISETATQYIYFSCTIGNLLTFATDISLFDGYEIQIEESSIVTDYEPYGYKIPITASGKNLLNEADLLNTDNWTFSTSYDIGYFTLDLEEGKTYTIYCKQLKASGNWGIVLYRGTTAIRNLLQYSGVYSFTATSHHLEFYVGGTYGAYNSIPKLNEYLQLMIVEGSYTSATIGDYEPYYEPITTNIYLDEPLRGIDSYLDCVGYKDEFLERNIAKRFILSSDVGNKSATSTNTWYSYFVQMPSNVVFSVRVLSNIGGDSYSHYMRDRANGDDGGFYANINSSYFLAFRDLTTKEEIQSYLDNTEVYAYYVIQPIETPITLPKLPTFKGTTIYKVGTSLQPANIEIKYYSNVKGE